MDTRARADQIRDEVATALEGSGVVVDGVHVHQAGRRSQVRVTVARDVDHLLLGDVTSRVEPLTLDEVASASRTVDDVLERTGLMGEGAFTLEVSSPGVDHPLTAPEQFRRNVGRLVAFELADGTTGQERIAAAGREGLRLGATGAPLLSWAQVRTATVQVEFTRHDAEEDD